MAATSAGVNSTILSVKRPNFFQRLHWALVNSTKGAVHAIGFVIYFVTAPLFKAIGRVRFFRFLYRLLFVTEAARIPIDLAREYKTRLENEEFCEHCGGFHVRKCPRVKRVIYSSAGNISEVEYWQDGLWPKADIVWPEDIVLALEVSKRENDADSEQ